MFDGIETTLRILAIGFLCAIGFGLYILFDKFGRSHDVYKTSKKPSISWELKTNGQKIDTVWVYTFPI